eukprot:3192928-Rhodomonas_salina.1
MGGHVTTVERDLEMAEVRHRDGDNVLRYNTNVQDNVCRCYANVRCSVRLRAVQSCPRAVLCLVACVTGCSGRDYAPQSTDRAEKLRSEPLGSAHLARDRRRNGGGAKDSGGGGGQFRGGVRCSVHRLKQEAVLQLLPYAPGP